MSLDDMVEGVSGSVWAEHRTQCASRHTAALASYPAHPGLVCPACSGKLRLWPATRTKFRCGAPDCARPGRVRTDGSNR